MKFEKMFQRISFCIVILAILSLIYLACALFYHVLDIPEPISKETLEALSGSECARNIAITLIRQQDAGLQSNDVRLIKLVCKKADQVRASTGLAMDQLKELTKSATAPTHQIRLQIAAIETQREAR